ncbi:MAG: hypothetical protein ACRD2W_24375 [Acidimicrobiales bacterium]
MSWLEFVASVVGSLAWPVTLAVVVVVLRAPLVGALSAPVKRWKAGPSGVEVEYWEQALSAARAELEQGDGLPSSATPPREIRDHDSLREELERLAEVSPSAAVVESFGRIEAELRSMLAGEDAADRLGANALARLARRRGLITGETLNAIEGLGVLRNLAAHGRPTDLDARRAVEFVALADAVLFALGSKPGR